MILSRPKNSRMPENINRVEDLGNIHDSVYENMLHEQASTTKTKKRKTREQNANYMREYRASIASTEENEKQSAYRKQYRSSNPENKRKHSEYMKQYRSSNPENKRKHSEYMKQYRTTTALAKQKAKNNAYMKSYRATSTKNIQYFISRFHGGLSRSSVHMYLL